MQSRVDRSWRVIATGFAFVVFGLGSLVIGLAWVPLLRVMPGGPERRVRRVQRAIHGAFRFFVGLLQALGLMRLRAEGVDRLRTSEPFLIVANHPTLIDAVLLLSFMPRVDCIVKKGVWDSFFLRGVVRAAGYIPNLGSEDLVARCAERLARGTSVLVFPEGTRSPRGGLGPFRRGAATIAARSGCRVLPVFLWSDPPTLCKGEPWYRIPPRPILVDLRVREPIDTMCTPTGFAAPAGSACESVVRRKSTDALRRYFEEQVHDARTRDSREGAEGAHHQDPGSGRLYA